MTDPTDNPDTIPTPPPEHEPSELQPGELDAFTLDHDRLAPSEKKESHT